MLKGYTTSSGYMGYVDGIGYLRFETDEAYYEYMEEMNDEKIYDNTCTRTKEHIDTCSRYTVSN